MRIIQTVLLLFFLYPAMAVVRVPAYISDRMMFQRDMPVNVWGWADKGEGVTVRLNGQSQKVKAGKDGTWKATLKPVPYGGPYELTIEGKNNTLTFGNILVGDIWVCSGQSNMEWLVAHSRDAEKEISEARYPNIRLLSVSKKMAATPLQEAVVENGGWLECSPETIGNFSAVGYFFGRELYRNLDIPVGLIDCSWGATNIETWTSVETIGKYPEYRAKIEDMQRLPEKLQNESTFLPNEYPALLYQAMVLPLTRFPIRGAIWYQGETNTKEAWKYRFLLPNMITDWRNAWKQDDLPFYFVQLANFTAIDAQPVESQWAELRESQHKTLSLPHTGEAVIIDIGDAADIHPKNKQDVGRRLALNALAKTYGKPVEYSGPEYVSMKTEGDRIVLKFSHTCDGLIAKKRKYEYLQGFAIAGPDRKFVWAQARIEDNNTVVVFSNEVKSPEAVRYAWSNNPDDANLYNSCGLPASPFRTDDWKLSTQIK